MDTRLNFHKTCRAFLVTSFRLAHKHVEEIAHTNSGVTSTSCKASFVAMLWLSSWPTELTTSGWSNAGFTSVSSATSVWSATACWGNMGLWTLLLLETSAAYQHRHTVHDAPSNMHSSPIFFCRVFRLDNWRAPWKNRTSRYISFFPSITQWCSISDILFIDGRWVSDFSVLKYY